MSPSRTVFDAALRLSARDDRTETTGNSLLVTLSGGFSQQKQRDALADLRLVLREVLRDKPKTPFGDAA